MANLLFITPPLRTGSPLASLKHPKDENAGGAGATGKQRSKVGKQSKRTLLARRHTDTDEEDTNTPDMLACRSMLRTPQRMR